MRLRFLRRRSPEADGAGAGLPDGARAGPPDGGAPDGGGVGPPKIP